MTFLTDGKWFPFVSLAHAADTVDLDLCCRYCRSRSMPRVQQNGSTVLVTSKGDNSRRQISTFGFSEECNDPSALLIAGLKAVWGAKFYFYF